MLTKKQNFLETIKPDGKPDRLVNQYEALEFFMGDPLTYFIQGDRFPGKQDMYDRWGTNFIWPESNLFPLPNITEATKVIKDICAWKDHIQVPNLLDDCSAHDFWMPYLNRIEAADRDNCLVTFSASTGIFERLHFLMGFEDTLMNFLIEPGAMHELCDAISEYRYAGFKLICEIVKPDVIISHDDWGSKESLFVHPDIWREFIRPGYEKCYSYIKEQDVVLIHHADSFLEPLVEDMVDLNIDVWQGVLPTNDIVKLQKQLRGRMTLMGGIDSGIDCADSTEEEIRKEVRRACETYGEGGHFIPSITYGGPSTLYPGNYEIISDEISIYNAASKQKNFVAESMPVF